MFYLYKESIQLDVNQIEVESLKELVKSMKKEDYIKVILYIYLLYDRGDENPIRDFTFTKRNLEAKSIAFGNESFNIKDAYDKWWPQIVTCIEDYKESVDKVQRDVDLYDKKIFQFIDLLTDVKNKPTIKKNVHDKKGTVSYSSNLSIISNVLESVLKIIYDKAQVVNVQKGGKFVKSLRGTLSPLNKGKINTST